MTPRGSLSAFRQDCWSLYMCCTPLLINFFCDLLEQNVKVRVHVYVRETGPFGEKEASTFREEFTRLKMSFNANVVGELQVGICDLKRVGNHKRRATERHVTAKGYMGQNIKNWEGT